MNCLLAATTVRELQLRLKGLQGIEAGVSGGVEQASLRGKALHLTGYLFIVLGLSNAFSSAKRTEGFKNVSPDRVPILTPFVVKGYGGPADIYYQLKSVEC